MTDETHEPFPSEDELSTAPVTEPVEVGTPGQTSTGIAWGVILLLLGIALLVVFSVQNTDSVRVNFLWTEGEFPLAIVILVTAGVIILLTELIGLSYRRRRRRRRAEREELRKYRAG